ncbi:E3 ubiquitin/ISG15 ligase TRIM25 [Gadus morhua]|uniref:E3 ubiquitin/ISG15 ligase TRIM25-like n=1 Tax=Gadus morhua TaxID=8049 RepID=A0A8C5AXZ5_GADMO|nr:E3 ubiquitin/ISG15 ligase TRIM25-like [Gadus morhua]
MACVHPELSSSVLREELTCPVCLDVYRDPRLLPCGHNFCLGCLRRLQHQAPSQRGHFSCPECRESHRCSAKFQKNFKLANIADDFRRRGRLASSSSTAMTSGEPSLGSSSSLAALPCLASRLLVPCDYCPPPSGAGAAEPPVVNGEQGEPAGGAGGASGDSSEGAAVAVATPAVKTCLKCEVSMCAEHVRPHLELPAFREHPLTDPLDDLRSRKCPSHDEIYRYYCLDDKVCVCNACTIEGGHAGHSIKTLRNTARDLKESLDKQLYRLERRFTTTEKKVHEQREKERQNRKFSEDSEQCLAALGEELKAKVDGFMGQLRGCAQGHSDSNRRVIQKNLQRVGQDQARLQGVRCGMETLLLENDPFRFIQAYKTTRKQCRRQLRRNLFYPEYVDMETDALGDAMNREMIQFLEVTLQSLIIAAVEHLRHLPEAGEEGEQEGMEEEEEEEEVTEEEDDDEEDDSSDENISEGEEEAEEEEEEEDQSDSADELYTPEEEDYEEEEGEEEEEEEDV